MIEIAGRLCQPRKLSGLTDTPYNYSDFDINSTFAIRHSAFVI